jgi:hypothetical protein
MRQNLTNTTIESCNGLTNITIFHKLECQVSMSELITSLCSNVSEPCFGLPIQAAVRARNTFGLALTFSPFSSNTSGAVIYGIPSEKVNITSHQVISSTVIFSVSLLSSIQSGFTLETLEYFLLYDNKTGSPTI